MKKITLDMQQVQDAYNSLVALGMGRETIVTEGGKEKAVMAAYKNFSGNTLMSIARNISALKSSANDMQESVRRRQRELQDDKGMLSPKDQGILENEIAEMFKRTEEFRVVMFKQDDFHLEVNNIPGQTLAGLLPFIDLEDDEAVGD